MRFREDKPEDLDRARAAVAAWRAQHPQGTADELVADLGSQFHPDYGPVLRAVLFAADRHRARLSAGVPDSKAPGEQACDSGTYRNAVLGARRPAAVTAGAAVRVEKRAAAPAPRTRP